MFLVRYTSNTLQALSGTISAEHVQSCINHILEPNRFDWEMTDTVEHEKNCSLSRKTSMQRTVVTPPTESIHSPVAEYLHTIYKNYKVDDTSESTTNDVSLYRLMES